MQQGKLVLAVRKRFSTERVVKHWNKTLGKWSSPQACQHSRSVWTMLLDTWFKFSVALCGVLMILVGPLQLKIFYGSVIT